MPRHKRRLTEEEVALLRKIMDEAPQGRKPTVRFFARMFNVNQPSILKSLESWDGIHRNVPQPEPKQPSLIDSGKEPVKIEPHTFGVEGLENLQR
jgi:hypothetical protein